MAIKLHTPYQTRKDGSLLYEDCALILLTSPILWPDLVRSEAPTGKGLLHIHKLVAEHKWPTSWASDIAGSWVMAHHQLVGAIQDFAQAQVGAYDPGEWYPWPPQPAPLHIKVGARNGHTS